MSAFEQDGEGVTATLVSPGGTPERVRALYLVGADGGHSLVRKRLGVWCARMATSDSSRRASARSAWRTTSPSCSLPCFAGVSGPPGVRCGCSEGRCPTVTRDSALFPGGAWTILSCHPQESTRCPRETS
ncbi:FAD-dependent monooxygenase [Cystobacter fuscus]|uniref:FAD-dependent monooxygenase n=1 Tax=Cystobacter fuscus TaxID=43 RepID=UPI0037BFE700